jgi:hypothetical protein
MILHRFSPLLLFLSAIGSVVLAKGPPRWADVPPHVREKFANDNFVKKEAFPNLPLQAIGRGESAVVFSRCNGGMEVSLGGLDPSPVSAFCTCMHDGVQVPCPSSAVFTKNDGGTIVTVTKAPSGEIDTIQVNIPGCGSESFLTVTPGLVASIPPDAYDRDELSKFVYGDGPDTAGRIRNLRIAEKNDAELWSNRELQNCPTRAINLALAFDSSYCTAMGSYNDAVMALTGIVTKVAALYEAYTCLTVNLVYVGGYCDASLDPYKDGVDLGQSGCGTYGLLQYFQNYWNNK